MWVSRFLFVCLLAGLLACSRAQSLSQSLANSAAQAASLAASLSASLGSGSMGSMGSGALPAANLDTFGMPVTMPAAALDSQGVPDPLDSGSSASFDSMSGSFSGSSSMGSSMGSLASALSSGASMMGSLSGSSMLSGLSSSMLGSGSSLSSLANPSLGSGSVTPLPHSGNPPCKKCCTRKHPCSKGDDPEPAKIVGTLTSGGKKFVDRGSKMIWSFGENSPHVGPSDKEAELQELDKMAAQDPELQKMIHNLEVAKTKMTQEKQWVDDVKNVITHYRAKIGSVTLAMKQQAKDIWTLKAQIIAKRKLDARKLLEQKLAHVQSQLKALQNAASNVSGEAKNLTQLKSSLSKSISSIEGEISKLRSK